MSKTRFQNFPLVLFEFLGDKGGAGIANLSCIWKPNPPLGFQECVQVVQSWILHKTEVHVQWPAENNTIWNLKLYKCSDADGTTKDNQCRLAVPVMMSSDKDELRKQLGYLVKSSKAVTPSSSISVSTNKPAPGSLGIATKSKQNSMVESRSQVSHTSTPSSSQSKGNRPLPTRRLDFQKTMENSPLVSGGDIEKSSEFNESITNDINKKRKEIESENESLKTKIAKLEDELRNSIEERKIVNAQMIELERYAEEKELTITTLSRQINLLQSQASLVEDVQNLIVFIKDDASKREQNRLSIAPPSSCHSTPKTRVSNLVRLDGDIYIDPNALKNAMAYGSSANTDHNMNLMINTILESLFTQNQLANFSLSGRPCPNMKGSKPKPKFPEETLTAIINYIRKMWKVWYKTTASSKSIKDGIGSKLRSCHTTFKKMSEKSAHIELPPNSATVDSGLEEETHQQQPNIAEENEEEDDDSNTSFSQQENREEDDDPENFNIK